MGCMLVTGFFSITRSPRGETFVTRKITRAIANILAGTQKKLLLGNLDAKRDWGYAKRICRGNVAHVEQDEPDDTFLRRGKLTSV